jgi:hypothetical protein
MLLDYTVGRKARTGKFRSLLSVTLPGRAYLFVVAQGKSAFIHRVRIYRSNYGVAKFL